MELDLGLKITKTRDDITSISEFRLAKDRAGPVFLSRETNTMFILTAYLKGYKRNNINIMISEDGSQISISGEKPIQELGRLKKDVHITGFKKVFRIPDGVILDRINAKFDREESMLKIFMPKSVKGICGVGIEELKEQECDRERLEPDQNDADQIPKKIGETTQGVSKESKIQETKKSECVVGQKMEERNFGKMPAEANGVINGDAMGKEIDESEIEEEDGNGGSAREGFEVRTSELEKIVDDHIPGSIQDTSHEVPKDSGIQQMDETRSVVEKMDGGESEKMFVADNGVTEENKTGETKPKENEEQKLETQDEYEESMRKEIGQDGFDGLKTSEPDQHAADHIPDDTVEAKKDVCKESDVQQNEETEGDDKQMDGGESKKMLSEINEVIEEDIIREVGRDDTDREGVREEVAMEEFEAAKMMNEKEFSGGPEATNVDKIERVQETIAEDEHSLEKVTGVHETLQVEANGGFRKDSTSDAIKEEMKQTKTESKDQGQQCVQEEIGEERFAANKTASQEIPMQTGESLAKRSEGMKDKRKEETKEIKEEEDKRKCDETKAAEKEESITKEEIQESGTERKYEIKQMTESSQKVPEAKRPQEVDLGSPQRETPPTIDTGTYPKVARTRSEVEEKGKIHEASQESPKRDAERAFQDSIERKVDQEAEKTETLHPYLPLEDRLKGKQEASTKEDRAQQQMQENINKEGFQTTKLADEELMKREHGAQTLPDKSEGPKPANMEESKEVSIPSIKTTLTAEDKKPETKETTLKLEGEKFHETKQVSGKMQETHRREHKKEPVKAPPRSGVEPPETKATRLKAKSEELKEVKPKTESEESQAMENVGFKKYEPKGDTDMPLTKELAHTSEELWSKEAYELAKPCMEQDASGAEIVPYVGEEKEPSNSVQGTEASKDVADKVAKPSTLPSPPSTQIFEVQGKEKADECYDGTQGEFQELPSPPSTQGFAVQGKELTDECYDVTHTESQELLGPPSIQRFEVQGKEQADEFYDGTHTESQELPSPPSTRRFEVQEKEQTDECYDSTHGETQELPTPPSTRRFEVQGKEQTDECYDGTHGESQELSTPPSTQRFGVQGKEQTDECYDGTHGESQESAQMKPDQQVERTETSRAKFSADQQDINYDQQIIGKEESCGEQMIQEETDNEQADRSNEVNSQGDCRVAASDEKKDDKRMSKKLCAPLIIVGSTFLVSVIVFFIHHRRARKSTK